MSELDEDDAAVAAAVAAVDAVVVAEAAVDWTRYQPHHERTSHITIIILIYKRYEKWTSMDGVST